jgi:hypothetical protein
MKTKPRGIKAIVKNFPRISIERVMFNVNGHIIAIDLHDEMFGEAVFFSKGDRHKHGFMNKGKYKKL